VGAEGLEAVENLVGAGSKLDDVAGVVTKLDDAGAAAMPINTFPGAEAIASYAERIPGKPGVYDVKLHGAPDIVEIALSDGRKVPADHRLLSKLITSQPDYAGEDIRLLSCSTGATENGIAQRLADKMGVAVEAPSDTLWIYSSGKTTIGPQAADNTGSWVRFVPGGGARP